MNHDEYRKVETPDGTHIKKGMEMIKHRITHRIVGQDPIVCLIKETDFTTDCGIPLYQTIDREADATFAEFVAYAKQIDCPSLVEHDVIDTQTPEWVTDHIRCVRSYQA